MQEGLNLRPHVYEPPALTIELRARKWASAWLSLNALKRGAAARRRLFGGAILAPVVSPATRRFWRA